jgi:lipopolysaccharide/colanic/teichoic acid biosynthesis glycosyltransferase
MSLLHLYQPLYSRVSKRCFDIVVAVVGVIVTAPLFVLIALLVRTTPGPSSTGRHGSARAAGVSRS